MKFMVFTMYNVAKAGEVAQAADKVANTPGTKILAQYACLGKPFDGVPPNNVVAITVREAESAEALFAVGAHLMFAGATAWVVPVMETVVGNTVAELKKLQK